MLTLPDSSAKVWIAVTARSEGEALVIADNRCLNTFFRICGESVARVTVDEYENMLTNAGNRQR